ncbi:hypothetical protein DYB26_011331 [Aphanomyces astaci]|uniref:EamA domain-containing protein n=2 Tax=Aphanomyces astaci TaxID=112090 RepID=A0A418G1W6_APHAT|nr:hypothetical protein DYB26_011331 [Aphanomyces astaci]
MRIFTFHSHKKDRHIVMSSQLGITYAVVAFIVYGMYPLFFKQIHNVPSVQIVLHRIVWSFVLLVPLFLWRGDWANFRATALTKPKTLAIYLTAAIAMGGAWMLFMWGVLSGYIIETSLGFFMNPIFSVILAVVVLKEPLRRYQIVSVALAFAGVLVVAVAYGKFPWLGLSLAIVLSIYGFIKKTAPLGSLDAVTLEMAFLFVPSLVALCVFDSQGTGAFLRVGTSTTTDVLLVFCGVVTVVPLLLFASAAPLMSFTLLGILQYIGPIMNFAIGVFVYNEPFSTPKLLGFVLVWLALTVFAVESVVMARILRRTQSNAPTEEEDESTSQSNHHHNADDGQAGYMKTTTPKAVYTDEVAVNKA